MRAKKRVVLDQNKACQLRISVVIVFVVSLDRLNHIKFVVSFKYETKFDAEVIPLGAWP